MTRLGWLAELLWPWEPFGRAPGWPRLRAEHLRRQPECQACGGRDGCVPHHIVPVHVDPGRELDPDNLLTLCQGAVNCHLLFGHLGDWRSYNERVVEDAYYWRRRRAARPHPKGAYAMPGQQPAPSPPGVVPGPPNLFQLGDFTLNSGRKSRLKIECDALIDADWETLAYLVWRLVGRFGSVEGVPRGGLKLAAALEQYRNRDLDGSVVVASVLPLPHLIVDDVLTTGGSMERLRSSKYRDTSCHPEVVKQIEENIIGAVVFARGPLPLWVRAVCPLPQELWTE